MAKNIQKILLVLVAFHLLVSVIMIIMDNTTLLQKIFAMVGFLLWFADILTR